jgi:hypothetical protein
VGTLNPHRRALQMALSSTGAGTRTRESSCEQPQGASGSQVKKSPDAEASTKQKNEAAKNSNDILSINNLKYSNHTPDEHLCHGDLVFLRNKDL